MSEEQRIIEESNRRNDIPEHPITKLVRRFLFQQRKREVVVIVGKSHDVNKVKEGQE